jgi:hypothetical protein
VRRRLPLLVAIALAAAAGLWLLQRAERPAAVSSEAQPDIDEASRAKLEQILEEADRREAESADAARRADAAGERGGGAAGKAREGQGR